MDVGSSFRIYGDMFGWQVFNQILYFVTHTGLWTIPFFFLLFRAFFGAIGGGEGFDYKPKAALKTIEMGVYPLLFLWVVFLMPVMPIHKTTFIYDTGKEVQEATNTGTTYDDLISSAPDGSIKIPFGWWTIMWVASGANYVIKLALPTGDEIRSLMYSRQQMAIDNPDVKDEFMAFETHCRRPANIRLNIINRDFKVSNLYQIHFKLIKSSVKDSTENFKVDPNYPGNLFYLNHLYNNNLCANNDVTTVTSTPCIPRTGGVLSPEDSGYGYNQCATWWNDSLKGKLEQDLFDWSGYITSLTGTYDFIKDKLSADGTDRIIYGELRKGHMKNLSETGAGSESGGISNPLEWIKQKIAALFTSIGTFFLSFPTTLIKFMLPIVLGTMIMVFTMLIPIMVILNLYRPDRIIQMAVLFFGLSFLPGIWHIAAWLDQVLLSTIWGDRTFIEGVFSLGHAAWGIMSMIIYLLLAKWWFQYLNSIGVKAAATFGGISDGAVSGANSTYSQGTSGAKKAASGGKKK